MTALAVVERGTVLGHTVPRVFTPPRVTGPPGPCGCSCALTPDTSDGFDAVDFATDVLGVPPDPWQRWLLIHGLELLPDGRPRFRRVVVLVARQNGKTYLLAILACFWMYLCGPLNVLGSSTKTAMAVKAWQKAIAMAKAVPDLAAEIPRRGGVLTGAGKEQWNLINGSRYEPVASNEEGGRGDSLDRVIADELRQHHDYSAYGASYHAMRNRPHGQFWALSSMGDDRSVVLNDLRAEGLRLIETGEGNDRLGLFEWSPPEGADPADPQTIAAANPSVNRFRPDGSGTPMDDLIGEALEAIAKGGDKLTDFLTEALNIRVPSLNPAIDLDAWAECRAPVDGFADLRGKVALCFDVAPSMQHATLYAAAEQLDGKVRLGAVKEWAGTGCADRAARELPAIIAKVKPRALGWLPNGPAAAVGSALGADRPGQWPPRGVEVAEIRGDLPQVAMGFASLVDARQVARGEEPLLDGQVQQAEKLPRGDAWVFSRKGEGDCDALYAAAGAAHLARQIRGPVGVPRVLTTRKG